MLGGNRNSQVYLSAYGFLLADIKKLRTINQLLNGYRFMNLKCTELNMYVQQDI